MFEPLCGHTVKHLTTIRIEFIIISYKTNSIFNTLVMFQAVRTQANEQLHEVSTNYRLKSKYTGQLETCLLNAENINRKH